MVMPQIRLSGRFVYLREIENQDLEILFQWRNSSEFRKLCSTRRNEVTLDEFKEEISADFEKDRSHQFMIFSKKNCRSIGMVYVYDLNSTDGHAFFSVFLESHFRANLFGAEAVALILDWLLNIVQLHKVYMDVYSYNTKVISLLRLSGFIQEGRFTEHRKYKENRYDLIRFTLFQSSQEELKCFLEKIQPRRKDFQDVRKR